ncbi:MAG: MBL fold metallo-hydrolase [Ruminococcaceae bacterium]|nr:MBL fold metallo-hydrolase [Oscillospiraceae bacterium]
MFEVRHLKGNTYYFEAFTNVGIYRLDESRVVLIDGTDHKRMAKAVNNYLKAENLTVDTIICTHCHVDHICGNRDFYEKYGCRILSTEKEKPFIAQPDLEGTFYYNGVDTDKSRNPFFTVEPSVIETLTEENLPDGLEIISLPGHSFDMIGVKTADGVFFAADSILSEKTWTEHKAPFFRNVNESIETLKKLKETEADIYVPSHNAPLTDIKNLADYNISKLESLKETAYELCDTVGFDEMFTAFLKKLSLSIRTEKYVNYSVMLKNLLQALVDDGKIKAVMDGDKFVYVRK